MRKKTAKKPTHKTESYYLSLLNIKWLALMGSKKNGGKSASSFLDKQITKLREESDNG